MLISICYVCRLYLCFECFLIHFRYPVIAHFVILRSILAHSQYLSSLFNWGCIVVSLFAIIARSFAYATVFIVILEVPSV